MFTKKFWIDALERAVKTFAQFLLTTGVFDTVSTDLSVSLKTNLTAAGMSALVSILTSIVSSGFGQKDSASVIDVHGDDG
jgi:ABC-type transport system involved in multi-copper enzyme maturation permease subunit